ncbi:MAG TPA: CBS domain-containing protein [Synechococcales cyanobacterium M55_K2018_004]|nr:CBS domain-containing protein [Synechococcales cyanobacterium M55_K2018_004]
MVKVKDIMTEDVTVVKGSATVAEAVRLMQLKGLHSLIVDRRSDDDAYGIVTDTDVAAKVVAYGKDPKQVKVFEIMTKPCIVVNPDLAVEYAARLFAQAKIDRAPVIQGELLGIVSFTDILQKGDFVENPRVAILERALQAAISDARAIAAAEGDSDAAKAAWENVAELEAELAFCKGEAPAQSAFEQYGTTPAAVPALA